MGPVIIIIFILVGVFANRAMENFIHGSIRAIRSLGHSPKNGRLLKLQLREFFGNPGGSIFLPVYKFFNPLCLELRELQLKHGISSTQVLTSLRPWLTEDIQFEEKVLSILKNSIAQFLILSAFTWIFYLNAKLSLGVTSSWIEFFVLQILGVLSFLIFYRSQKQKHFTFLEELFERAFMFKTLKTVGISISEVLLRSKADQALKSGDKVINVQADHLLNLSQKWTTEGFPIDNELEEFLGELCFLREERRRKFELKLGMIRFIHLVVFYLLGYLLVILGLIRQLASSY